MCIHSTFIVFCLSGTVVGLVRDHYPSPEMTQGRLVSLLHHSWIPYPLFFPLFPPGKISVLFIYLFLFLDLLAPVMAGEQFFSLGLLA